MTSRTGEPRINPPFPGVILILIMDEALILARAQFGLNIAFHILFPAITIGLSWMLVAFRLRYERARSEDEKRAWLATYKLWVKVFALSFAMGVVSGVV